MAPEEDIMATTAPYSGRHGQDHFHPAVYWTMAAFAILMITASWGFFGDGGLTGYLLTIVTGFVLATLALPYMLRRIRLRDTRPWRGSEPPAVTGQSFTDWEADEFHADRSRISGKQAMIQAVLPIAAVGIGMLLFAIVVTLATGDPSS
jgi:hypothetical protein